MSHLRTCALILLSAGLAACSGRDSLTGVDQLRTPGSARRTMTPAGTLDQNITALFATFSKGQANAGQTRWDNVKRKYADGTTDAQQMKVAKSMLVELVAWVQQHSGEITPPTGETSASVASRLVLYMSMYVYNGPASTPPTFVAAADNAVTIVSPSAADTVVTPTQRAGASFPAGSVDEATIVVVTENPTPYPAACSGPLATRMCQYPRFYTFDAFPHNRLNTPAKFAVCHVNDGTHRLPLADHDRFRLAHAKPANPADYTPGSTIRDQNGESVEILPLASQTFVACNNTDYAMSHPFRGTGLLSRLANAAAGAILPKSAYAIDVGGGGFSLEFSPFNVIDPLSAPDRSVTYVTAPAAPTHAGDHVSIAYSVKNTGTATSTPVLALVRSGSTAAASTSGSGTLLDSLPIPALAPGDSVSGTLVVALPYTTAASVHVGLAVGDDPTLPDANLANNTSSAFMNVDPSFHNIPARFAVGEISACGLSPSAGTYCWGDNGFQQLGQATPSSTATPFAAPATQLSFVELSEAHVQFYCGIKSDRSATCWGRNGTGQLGRGSVAFSAAPGTVSGGISWAQISAGRLNACGVSLTGVGYCWGSNQDGEEGRASVPTGGTALPTLTLTPAIIDGGHTWKQLVAGWTESCGITSTSDAYCWGSHNHGQLGNGAPLAGIGAVSPTAVSGGLKFIQLSVGGTHVCGITVDHLAYCWGSNFSGQLGDGTTTDRSVPTPVAGGLHFSFIAAGDGFGVGGAVPAPTGPQGVETHTCALTENGAAYCWGLNGNGQLGDGTLTDHLVPTAVAGGLNFTHLYMGGSSTCGSRGNALWCWGGNASGQLGNGSLAGTTTPVLVSSPLNVP